MSLTDREAVRLHAVGNAADTEYFSDAEVDYFLDLEGGDVRMAAAAYCDALAGDAALVAKLQASGTYQSSKISVPTAIRAQAKELRKRAAAEPYSTTCEDYTYPWANAVVDEAIGLS